MKRKISILFAICLLCALASGCSGEKSVSKVELPAVVPESPAQESVTPESTAQDLPEQNNSAPSQADVELDVPDAPEGKIKKSDVTVAKNYLSQDEMKQLNRMVTAYLDFAENMTLRHIPLTMQDWEKRLNSFIEMFDYGILQDAGKVSAEIAKLHAETEFEKYRVIQDSLFMSDFDRYMLELEESAKK